MEAKWAMQQKEALKKISGKSQAKLYITSTLKNSNDSFTFLILCSALVSLYSFMNWYYMSAQVWLSCKTNITNVAFERFYSFMNWWHMFLQVPLFCKASITNVAFERPFSFMNWGHMCFQVAFLGKASITNVAFERLLPFMNC